MLALARETGSRAMSARRIADRMAIPAAILPRIMADLARHGLVRAVAGRNGGYGLARPPSEISLLDVIEAIEGDSRRRACVLRGVPCGEGGLCDVHDAFAAAQDAMLERFAATSLASLLADPMAAREPPEPRA